MSAYITSIGTANPDNRYKQEDIANFMCDNLAQSDEEKRKLRILYRATGIEERYSILDDYKRKNGDFKFFKNSPDLQPFPSTSVRMKLYREQAVPLAISAITNCINGSSLASFTHLITVSCTGMYAPGLDVDLIKTLNLSPSINRTSINFMGCYAAMNALGLAKQICQNQDAKVLIVSVELCTLHLQSTKNEDNLLAHSLFADGAAAVVVSSQPSDNCLEIKSSSSYLAISGKNDMAWQIGDFGFEMALTSYVPDIIKSGIHDLTRQLLEQTDMDLTDIDGYAIHPGGKRILESIEAELGLTKADNRHAYEVLKHYGNMSSPTILFVLKRVLAEQRDDQNILSFAFGPGLTMESILFKSHTNV
ncbi:Predicted naringenin-chalcone synthase [Reichenbachiella agariperforans]|uniref:Predicted naringenin-chalcone synthase n=1 Tax=Reichenbachiella agariperforans TaxID=156994 RepID=A0A1M6TXU1_REIAG|nr:type III polyketide synthase [Reichenbachiella agariperforans]SHK61608.1 Predicted naringenin-chalcone synthase [Reichenbachiella agariperforans]